VLCGGRILLGRRHSIPTARKVAGPASVRLLEWPGGKSCFRPREGTPRPSTIAAQGARRLSALECSKPFLLTEEPVGECLLAVREERGRGEPSRQRPGLPVISFGMIQFESSFGSASMALGQTGRAQHSRPAGCERAGCARRNVAIARGQRQPPVYAEQLPRRATGGTPLSAARKGWSARDASSGGVRVPLSSRKECGTFCHAKGSQRS
jgi:hypothetical protein